MILIRRAGIVFLAILLFFVTAVNAQQDTTVADTIVVGADASPSVGAAVDSSSVTGTDQETAPETVDSVILRSVPDSIVERWKKNPRFAYANDPAYWRRAPESHSGLADFLVRLLTSAGFRYFVYILLGALLIFVIVRIITENNLGVFYRRRVGRMAGGGGPGDGLAVEEDLDERLQYYLSIGDHRQTIRYLYLRTLRGLDERGLIRQTIQATNHDYLRQLSGTSQERPFRFLTTAYEMVWYGEFVLGEEQFRRLYQHFVDFDKTVQP